MYSWRCKALEFDIWRPVNYYSRIHGQYHRHKAEVGLLRNRLPHFNGEI